MAELVGILNITPDSFSDGGRCRTTDTALAAAATLYAQGAIFLDVGAESTRPGATPLSWQEEVGRLSGTITHAAQNHWPISLDTYHPETIAWAARQLTRFIINDVTCFRSPMMRDMAARLDLPVIMSHLPEASSNIQDAHQHKPIDSLDQVSDELQAAADRLACAGVARHNITMDPGIGFGKTIDVNWELLEFARVVPDYTVMIGYSRKRFLGEGRMEIEPNLRAGRIAVAAGAAYLRVHDVQGHMPLVR